MSHPVQAAAVHRMQQLMSASPVPSISTELLATADGELNRELKSFLFDPPSDPEPAHGQADRHLLHERRRGGGDPGRSALADRARRHGPHRLAAHRRIRSDAGPALPAAMRHPRPGDPPDGKRRLAQDRPLHRRGEAQPTTTRSCCLAAAGTPMRCAWTSTRSPSCAPCTRPASRPAPSAMANG